MRVSTLAGLGGLMTAMGAALPAAHADTLFFGPVAGTQSTVTGTSADLGALTLPSIEDFGAYALSAGGFSDRYSFSVPGAATFGGAAMGVSFALTGSFPNFSLASTPLGLTLALFQGNGTSFTQVASSTAGSLTDQINAALGSNFYLLVSGTAPANAETSAYGGAFRVSPVPEAGTLVMILSGLVVMGGVLRRRGVPRSA